MYFTHFTPMKVSAVVEFISLFVISSSSKELFDTSLNELSSNLYSNPESDCIKLALGDVLSECKDFGLESLDTKKRKTVALKITICELNSLNLQIPMGCEVMDADVDFDICLLSLEKVPQYWTTFSGNYRELKNICSDESVPNHKNQIVNLYTNITKVFHNMYQKLETTIDDTSYSQANLQNRFNELDDLFKLLAFGMVTTSDISQKSQQMSIEVKEILEYSVSLLNSLVSDTSPNIKELMVNVNFLTNEIKDLRTAFVEFDLKSDLIQVKQEVLDLNLELKNSIIDTSNHVISQLDIMQSKIEQQNLDQNKMQQVLQENFGVVETIAGKLAAIDDNSLALFDSIALNKDQYLKEIFENIEDTLQQLDQRLHNHIALFDIIHVKIINSMAKLGKDLNSLAEYWTLALSTLSTIKLKSKALFLIILSINYNACIEKVIEMVKQNAQFIFTFFVSMCTLSTLVATYVLSRLKASKKRRKSKSKNFYSHLFLMASLLIVSASWSIVTRNYHMLAGDRVYSLSLPTKSGASV